MFRRGVTTMIGVGVPSFQFNEINRLEGARRRRWGAFFRQHSQMATVIERSLRETLSETPDEKVEATQLAA